MTRDEILQAVRKEVSAIITPFRVGFDEDDYDVPFPELGSDSLDDIEVIIAIETKLGVEIPDDEIPEVLTINSLTSAVATKVLHED